MFDVRCSMFDVFQRPPSSDFSFPRPVKSPWPVESLAREVSGLLLHWATSSRLPLLHRTTSPGRISDFPHSDAAATRAGRKCPSIPELKSSPIVGVRERHCH